VFKCFEYRPRTVLNATKTNFDAAASASASSRLMPATASAPAAAIGIIRGAIYQSEQYYLCNDNQFHIASK
jgi:hypothetical protein